MREHLTVADLVNLLKRKKKVLSLIFGISVSLSLVLFTWRHPLYVANALFQDTPGAPATIKEKLADKNPFQSSPFYKGKGVIK